MQFDDDPVGGVVLVRPAIQSPDYKPGVSGWAVKIDGSAEFNDVVIRGGTSVSGVGLYYNGTPGPGNLMLSIAGAPGTDAYGNSYPAGLTLFDPDGSEIQLLSGNGASLYLTPQGAPGVTWAEGQITTTLGASDRPGVSVSSPAASTGVGSRTASLVLFGEGPTTTDTSILVDADRFDIHGTLSASSQAAGTAQTPAPGGAPAQTSVNVSFGKTFPAIPSIQVTPNSGSTDLNAANIRWAVTNKSTTGFTINCWRSTNFATNFEWWASL